MKLLKKTCAMMLSFVMVFLSTSESLHALADAAKATNTTTITNDFIKVTVDNATGRYGVRTVDGQPIRKKDQNTNLLFQGDDPETSFTTFRIDGTDYIYGNKYKFDSSFYSETTAPKVVENSNGTKQLEMLWKIKGVEIKQILMLYTDSTDKVNSGNINIRYEVNNKSGAVVEVGSRILLDTMVGANDGPLFQIGTAYQAPLMVERKLTHDPRAAGIPEEDAALYKLPSYWVMRDKLDLTNPQATNVVAYGFNNIAEQNINIVDEMIVGHWNGLANTKWDYKVNPNLDFTRDTNDYGSADSAVAFYWNPDKIAAGGFQSFETVYGLGEIIAPDKVFSVRFVDQIQQLATLEDNSAYRDEGIFDITAEVENLAAFNMEHSKINVKLELESGLDFVKLDSKGAVVRDANGNAVIENTRSRTLEFKKSATPEEAEQGIQPKYKPGDTIAASFKVKAKGRPWPVTREYMLTASSPETQSEIEGIADESIKAQYESSKSNFILLPPVGEATPTYVYGMSPDELYSTDVKYMTVNLSNIEAYNTGNDTTAANFDLYLKETVTGERYKINVQDAVVMQPTDDGMSGDMRITYRGGDMVDEAGNVIEADLGPELPLGEYQVEIDYKGDAGGDEEIASMYDITTEQTILVSDNDESRIREAGIMVVYKQLVDVSGIANGSSVSGDLLDDLNSLFPNEPFKDGAFLYNAVTEYKKTKAVIGMASKAVDPEFELSEFMDDEALEETPLYNYQLFDSEEDLEAFEAEAEDEEIDREVVVVIRGMIKQVGSKADEQVIVDTKTEPAIINDAVAYTGKDLAFVRGKLNIFGQTQSDDMPFLDTLFIKGDGTLSVASSGFIFHKGEWTLDFFNGFNKSLGDENFNMPSAGIEDDEDEEEEENTNPEDDTQNGSLKWAVGGVGDRLNPLRQVMIEDVYFNRQSLFAAPSFSIDGFGLSFNDFMLREGGISFGGSLSMKIINAEINNVVFNDKGFVGIDAALKFDLGESVGLFGPKKEGAKKKDDDGPKSPSGEITVTHFVQEIGGEPVENQYGLAFDAQLKNMLEVSVELSLKKVRDGRILPDVIAFGAGLPSPGILITGATYLTGIRGAVRELADTIAGGSKDDPFPLTVSAGVSLRFGMAPAYFFGDVDLTVKRTGLKVEGKMDFSTMAEPEDDDKLPMLTKALLEAQWVTPWFVRVQAEMDIGGWDIIIGKAGIFVGQNLEKNRTDFEGYIGSKIQIPNSVPIVGGMPLSSMFLGVNNDKVWGSIGILLISLGITYYWGGGVEFGTSTDQLPDGVIHLVVDDPELGPRLMVIGQGVETLATSEAAVPAAEQENQEIVYREVAEGVDYVENGSLNVSVGGITVKNSGRVHEIPMDNVTGNAVIEMEYESKDRPEFTLKDGSGKAFPVKFDNTNTDPTANAFTQYIPASSSKDQVDVRKAYIIVPADKVNGGKWTLTAVSPVKTKLLNVPTAPQLNDIVLAKDNSNADKFNASWKVANAAEGDTINLYLAQDAVSKKTTTLDNGEPVLEAGDPGLLIAKDIPVGQNGGVSGGVTSGSTSIDVTNVTLMGNPEDIRGLLRQGNYYLRAELKSSATFATKTSVQKFEIVDPFAPQNVSDLKVEPAGNGLFALSFKPGAKKAGHSGYEHSYIIDAKRLQDGEMKDYDNFGEILFTEEELAPYWNASTGKYEGILIGGWSATSTTDEVDLGSLEGTVMDLKDVKYVGLEVGYEYEIGVSAATVPTEADDKNQNYHYADRIAAAKKLLPVPVKPKLNVTGQGTLENTGAYINLLTKQTEQTLTFTSDQKNVTVEAFYAEESIGKVALSNTANGSQGTLKLTKFQTDGPFAVELRATNTATKDLSVTMLYLTVDTIAPVLYIDQPATGARTANDGSGNKITVAGTTTKGTLLKVGSTVVPVAEDGTFNAEVPVASADPTVALQFTATDGAGNENTAVVNISNESFDVPSALILEQVPALQPGDKSIIAKAYLKVADGKDENGKLKYKQVEVSQSDMSKITYSVASGDSVDVVTVVDQATQKRTTTVTALATGSSLITGEYTVTDGVTIQGYTVASVEVPEPVKLGSLVISAVPAGTNTTQTRIIVSDSGDMTGQQLAYKIYSSGQGGALPAFQSDLSDWQILPADGAVFVKPGDEIVVAKRTSMDKLAMAAAQVTAVIYSALPGNGPGAPSSPGAPGAPGAPGPVAPAPAPEGAPKATLNGQDVEATWNGTTAVIHLTDSSKAADGTGDITISSSDTAAGGFDITVDQSVVQQAVTAKKNVVIQVPFGSLVLTPDHLSGLNGPLRISIGSNNANDKTAMSAIASTQNFTVLGAGEGVHVAVNLPSGKWAPALKANVAIPSGIAAGGITAVVLKDASGNWTTIPWKLNSNSTAVDVQLTGEGSLFFISNKKVFKDVAAGFWAQQDINAASGKLFVLGKAADSFAPQSKVTRAELPTILLRVAGLMNNPFSKQNFSDVSANSWYSRSVSIAAELGIVTGQNGGQYAPQATLSRMEAMTMVGRLLNVISAGGETLSEAEVTQILAAYADKDSIPAWARQSIALSIKYGIIRGVDGNINPAGVLTRAEAATIAIRLDQYITDKQ
ncbi:S-layer homology domain-containing protein [Paenibacillus camerounensis]|uniref:S-layer homology domain-containing protein n=1 Tax=Paenibacillus camerounensis TaxID=1243663 RepID=UPI0005A8123E|nr:S-layer homology domain-containing protein [Paenibacillus camerounensis]